MLDIAELLTGGFNHDVSCMLYIPKVNTDSQLAYGQEQAPAEGNGKGRGQGKGKSRPSKRTWCLHAPQC